MVDIHTTVKNKDLVEKRRTQIILAAIKLFSQKGFHKTTLKELAEESGLSHGNIYDYVGNKEDIFYLIHAFVANKADKILTRAIKNVSNPIDKMRRVIRSEFNLMDQWADAVMLLYQETHILSGTYLKKLLQKERAHVAIFEKILQEGIERGLFRPCNVRVTANLIKSMIDTWTVKRWDLYGQASRREVEQSILDVIFQGLLSTESSEKYATSFQSWSLKNRNALIVNAGSVTGLALCRDLANNGVNVIAQVESRDVIESFEKQGKKDSSGMAINFLAGETDKVLSHEKLEEIESRYGAIDIYIHDLGAGTSKPPGNKDARKRLGEKLESKLRCAQNLAEFFQKSMAEKPSGRIIYLFPRGMDTYAGSIRYETALAGSLALCRAMAKKMSPSMSNVNGINLGYMNPAGSQQLENETADIIETVFFLISNASESLNGQIFDFNEDFAAAKQA
ncbi:MAG: SDR family NAD(P)-dependent oxidoreductase [Desulfosalsimonas sp.]